MPGPVQRSCVTHLLLRLPARSVTLHITPFEGGNALGNFRAQQLLPALQAIHERIAAVGARFVHLVGSDLAPGPVLQEQLAALLRYGDPYEGSQDGVLLVVTPRFGTVSPWASKATDIAHNCGLALRRIERITEYRITLKAGLLGKPVLSEAQRQRITGLLHDRMTESVMFDRSQASGLLPRCKPRPWPAWTYWVPAGRRWTAPTPSSGWRWPTMKSTTWCRPSRNCGVTPATWS